MRSLGWCRDPSLGFLLVALAGGLGATSCGGSAVEEPPAIPELPPDVMLRDDKADGQSSYEALAGCTKQEYLWQRGILASRYRALPALTGAGGWTDLLGLARSFFSLGTSFDHISDQMPVNRVKFIHPFGAVATVSFEADQDSPYTGLFQETSVCGLARLSLAGDPRKIGYTPGMAIKLFVDGKPSVNLHVMQSLNGQGTDQNFFANDFSNRIPRPTGFTLKLLEAYFATTKRTPTQLPVDHLARVAQDGSEVRDPRVPYQLIFSPAGGHGIDSATPRDFREELAQIPEDAVLYEVWARSAEGAEPRHLGRLVTSSRFVASRWGDEGLFFRHQR